MLNGHRRRQSCVATALVLWLIVLVTSVSVEASRPPNLDPRIQVPPGRPTTELTPPPTKFAQDEGGRTRPSCAGCVLGNISVGPGPWTPTYDPSTNDVYVSDWSGGNAGAVSLVSVPLDVVLASIPVGDGPFQPALDPANGYLYVSNYGSDNVSVIAGANRTLIDSIPVGSQPEPAAVDPLTGQVFIANSGAGTVSVIDGSTDRVSQILEVGGMPTTPTFDPSNGDMYLPTGGAVDVIAPSSAKVVASIPVGGNPAVLYDPVNNQLYVANFGSASVSIIDGATDRVTSTLAVGMFPTVPVLDPVTGEVYVVNDGSSNVSVISGLTDTIVATIPVGLGPESPAYDPGSGNLVVPDAGSRNLSIVSGVSHSVVATLKAGTNPGTPTYIPGQNVMFVPDYFSANLTIVGLAPPRVYSVTFVEHGLPGDTLWAMTSAAFGFSIEFSSAPEISFSSPNGSYWFVANFVQGYAPSESAFTVGVHGAAVLVDVDFAPTPHGSSLWALLEYTGLLVIGLAAGVVLTTVTTRRRIREKPPPRAGPDSPSQDSPTTSHQSHS